MIRRIMMALALAAALGAASDLGAQAADTTKKPGGVNKVARDVSKTMKKAGRDTKAEVKRTSSRAHHELTDAGNDTKRELKRVTGASSKPKGPNHKPGGVNKVARKVSAEGKKLGAKAKHGVKENAGDAHRELTRAGKQAKSTVKDSTKPNPPESR